MKIMLMLSSLLLGSGLFADMWPFWYQGDASVTNRSSASLVQVSTTRVFDMRFYAWGSMSLLRFASNPVSGMMFIFK